MGLGSVPEGRKSDVDTVESLKSLSQSHNRICLVQGGRYWPFALVFVITFLIAGFAIGSGSASDGTGDTLPVLSSPAALGNLPSDPFSQSPQGADSASILSSWFSLAPVSPDAIGTSLTGLPDTGAYDRITSFIDSRTRKPTGPVARLAGAYRMSAAGGGLTEKPFSSTLIPANGKGEMESMAGTSLMETQNSPGTSRYIVTFKETTPFAAKQSRDRVVAFTESHSGRVVHEYGIINAMTVRIPDDEAAALSAQDNVKYVEKDQIAFALLDGAVEQIGADQVRDAGYTGKGVKVCVIDTGIDVSHPDLNNGKVIGWMDYVGSGATPYDDHGHGTHVASTIAGTGSASGGQYTGVAPDARLMGAKVLSSSGSGSYSSIIAAIDWAVQNDAHVISMSLGGPHSQAMDDAVNSAISQGVIVVVAAGNDGPASGTIRCPGDVPAAITVGAVDRNDVIASFSSRGPTSTGYTKPDVTNMGVGLVAARASGTSIGSPVDTYYTAVSGTSMACPMTSGVVALLLEKNSGLTPAQIKEALTTTAKPLGTGIPNNHYGYGRVQAKAALDYVTTGIAPPTPTPTPAPVISETPHVEWSQSYSEEVSDMARSARQTTDGGYVLAGATFKSGNMDVYLVKTDAAGEVTWARTYGGYSSDQGNAVLQTADGGYVITGYTESYTTGYRSVYLVKTDAAGNMEWNRTYSRYYDDEGYAVCQTADGGYVISGSTYVGYGNTDLYLIRTDAAGNMLWDKTFGGSSNDIGLSVGLTADDGFILSGQYRDGSYYAWLIKTDGNGNNVWNHTYQSIAGMNTYGVSAQQTADSGYCLAGVTTLSGIDYTYLLKTDELGNFTWNQTYSATPSSGSSGISMQQTNDGGYVISGYTEVYGGYELYLIKTDGSGMMSWQDAYNHGSAIITYGYSVRQTADNGYIVCGMTCTADFELDPYLVKTDVSGNEQWYHVYGEQSTDMCAWAQQTADGGFILTGLTDYTGSNGYDASLIRTDGNGNVVWRSAYGGSNNDMGSMVLQTADGGYAIAGTTYPSGGSYSEAYLVKTDSSGNEDWEQTYGSDSDDWANAVQQTADGGYVLAGGKYDPDNGDMDAYLVKTDRSGVEQWGYRYGGHDDDWGSAVLQTADGGYLFAGGSYSYGSGDCDICIMKVDSTGGYAWGYIYGGTSDDWANSIQPSGDGGFIVTGGSLVDGKTKIFLIKITSSGATEWVKFYGESSYQEGMSVGKTSDGGYVIGGTVYDDSELVNRMVTTKTDASGNLQWAVTGNAAGNSYGYYARQTTDNGYVLAGTAYAGNRAQACLIKLSATSFVPGSKPIQVVPAPPMQPPLITGGVSGRITMPDTSVGIANAYVAIINASNISQAYYVGQTDSDGYYVFTNVPHTATSSDETSYESRYRLYANQTISGYNYSANFSVQRGSTAAVNLVIGTISTPVPTPVPIPTPVPTPESKTCVLPLHQDWNLISIPLELENNDIASIFSADVLDDITDIWGWDESVQNWVYYSINPDDYFYQFYPKLTRLETGRAYWVRMVGTASVTVEGTVPEGAPDSPAALVPGWNFVGLTDITPVALTSMYPDATDVWGWDESVQNWVYYSCDPDDYFYQYYPKLNNIMPGDGYWVRLV